MPSTKSVCSDENAVLLWTCNPPSSVVTEPRARDSSWATCSIWMPRASSIMPTTADQSVSLAMVANVWPDSICVEGFKTRTAAKSLAFGTWMTAKVLPWLVDECADVSAGRLSMHRRTRAGRSSGPLRGPSTDTTFVSLAVAVPLLLSGNTEMVTIAGEGIGRRSDLNGRRGLLSSGVLGVAADWVVVWCQLGPNSLPRGLRVECSWGCCSAVLPAGCSAGLTSGGGGSMSADFGFAETFTTLICVPMPIVIITIP